MLNNDVSSGQRFDFIDGFTMRHYAIEGVDYSLNDDELLAVFRIMDSEVGIHKLFYSERIYTFSQFKEVFAHDGKSSPVVFAFKDGLLYGVCWLTGIEGKSARLHFFCSKAARMTLNTVNVGKAVLRYYSGLKGVDGEPLLQSLVGVTPASYKLVLKYIQQVGFSIVGVAKGGVHFVHENRYDDAVLSIMQLQEEV